LRTWWQPTQLVTINVLSVMFITSRLLYIICYLADWSIAALADVVCGDGD
jgi:uncharacterized MAPEG superfamily protein